MMLKKNKYTALFFLALILALASYAQAVRAERADRDQPIRLEAARVSIDDAKQISTFEGAVQLSQGSMIIRGDKIVVAQDKNGMRHGTATGQPASFRQKREGLDEYVEGYGERIEYDSKTETVDFYGQARMQRGRDEVRGKRITYNFRTEIFQAMGSSPREAGGDESAAGTGRVHVIIQPKNKSAPSTTVEELLPIKPAETLTPPESAQ